ncbi:uncharacterized protein LOC141690922 [Apium graveolens]|uniref:uncharacterized protein LOC141690922 n=1 Tax=Apium graveolens TaxID=4045 RepID=UPI003D79BD06
MSSVEDVSEWLVHQINHANSTEVTRIARVLWGIWFFRNKKVWENKSVNHNVAMDWSSNSLLEWRNAKKKRSAMQVVSIPRTEHVIQKWLPPPTGSVKLNVDASISVGANDFSTGMLIRDHEGNFLLGRVACISGAGSVLEAEITALYEGLCWIKSLPYQNVLIESDSLLTVQAV